MELSKGYTNTLEILNECNYIDPEKSNSSDFILSCINQPNQKNPIFDNYCINMSIQLEDNVEGFANDHSSQGPGVSYTPLGVCPDGYIRDENGKCNLQEYRGRTRDGDWQRSPFSEIMHFAKENYKICGSNKFIGLSNGHPMCENNEDAEEQIIEGFNANANVTAISEPAAATVYEYILR